jgi:hypothetical protein
MPVDDVSNEFDFWFLCQFPHGIFSNASPDTMYVAEAGFKQAFKDAFVAGHNLKTAEGTNAD